MEKRNIIKKLAKANNVKFLNKETMSELTKCELAMSDLDERPLFRFINNDKYSAIDIDPQVAGASILQRILSTPEEEYFNLFETKLLLALVLNHDLSSDEEAAASIAVSIYKYRCRLQEDIKELVKIFTRADNSWDMYQLYPVQLALFLLFANKNDINSFAMNLRACTHEGSRLSAIIDKFNN